MVPLSLFVFRVGVLDMLSLVSMHCVIRRLSDVINVLHYIVFLLC
jgi:hypothetical protein